MTYNPQEHHYTVTDPSRPYLAFVLEWLLNNGGAAEYYGSDWMDDKAEIVRVEADTRSLETAAKARFGKYDACRLIGNLWLANRLRYVDLQGFDGDKGTKFSFLIYPNMMDCDTDLVVKDNGRWVEEIS